jgi:hypothetical protein
VNLPLAIDTYPEELRSRVFEAVRAVVESEPLPPGPTRKHRQPRHQLPGQAPFLVAAYGKKRAGKTTVADFLAIHFEDVVEINFSAPMIEEVNSFLAHSGHLVNDHNKADVRYRFLLQVWAEARRFEQADYWTERILGSARSALAGGARMVIAAGLRQPDELDAFYAEGGEVWKVARVASCVVCGARSDEPHEPGCREEGYGHAIPDSADERTDRHYTEIALDEMPDERFSLVIENDGDLLALCSKAITAVTLDRRGGASHLGRL